MEDLMERLNQRTPAQSLLRGIGRFGKALVKPELVGKEDEEADVLDRLIKMNQLQTGSPEFKMQEAQTRANLDVQKGLDLENAKIEAARQKYDEAMLAEEGGGIPQGSIEAPIKREYDPAIGRVITKPGTPSASRLNAKDKRTEELFGMFETNSVKRDMIDKAKTSLPNVPQGLIGKGQMWWMKNFDPNNATLTDWQNVKAVLTDAQLMKTAMTKGAISDKEMGLLGQAAANDDVQSVARMKPVIDRLSSFLDADEDAALGGYKRMYGEDPGQWPEIAEKLKGRQTPAFFSAAQPQGPAGASRSLSFASEADAEAANLPPGTQVTINGRKARIA